MTASEMINKIGGPLSIGIPLAAVWAYYGHWLGRHIDSVAEPVRRGGMKRIYAYILSAVGLGGTLSSASPAAPFHHRDRSPAAPDAG